MNANPNPAPAITDEQLDAWKVGANKGNRNSEGFLRPFSPEMRAAIVREAHTIMATSPGWNFSASVWQASKTVPNGSTPAGDLADKLMAHDPTGQRAAAAASQGRPWGDVINEIR